MCIVVVPRCVVGMAGRRAAARTAGAKNGRRGGRQAQRATSAAGGRHKRSGRQAQRAAGAENSRRGAIQVPAICIGPAEQAQTMMFMLYFSLRKRKP